MLLMEKECGIFERRFVFFGALHIIIEAFEDELTVVGQLAPEVLPGTRVHRGPAGFRNGAGARIGAVENVIQGREMLSPHGALNADDMVRFFFRFAVGGIQLIALFQRGGGHPSPVVLPWNLRIVQVAVFSGSNDQGESLFFCFCDGGRSLAHAPGEDGVSFVVNVGFGPRFFIP